MKNTIFISKAITSATLEEVFNSLRSIAMSNSDPIEFVINSPGGDIAAAFGIIDCIELIPNQVNTFALGQCCSAAVLVFLSGINRRVTPNVHFTIHEPFVASTEDSILRVKNLSFDLEKLYMHKEKILELFESKTKITKDLLENKYSNDNWLLRAEACLEYGIATEIATSIL